MGSVKMILSCVGKTRLFSQFNNGFSTIKKSYLERYSLNIIYKEKCHFFIQHMCPECLLFAGHCSDH